MSRTRANTVTTTPDMPGPSLFCPVCERQLAYRQTVFGGVQPSERWDYLQCTNHGWFNYRHRTRRLTPMPAPGEPSAPGRRPRRPDDDE